MSDIDKRDRGIGKTASESAVTMTELVLPNDTNALNNLLGGRLMHWIDIAAALAASRHSNRTVATRAVENLDFRHPIGMGEMVTLNARLESVGRTSMRVNVTVYAEHLQSGERHLANEATLIFVALDDEGRPTQVPPLLDS